MKYGIRVDGRLTEVFTLPDPLPFGGDIAGFLAIMFPGKTGWKEVPDASVNGTLDDGNGNYTHPTPSASVGTPKILTKKEVRALATSALAAGIPLTAAAASARLQAYIDAAKANVGTTNGDKNMRWALSAWQEDTFFGKDEADQIMLGLQFQAGDKSLIDAAWPLL